MGPQNKGQEAKGFMGFSGRYKANIIDTKAIIMIRYMIKWIYL